MGVVNAGSSPAPALQDSLTDKDDGCLFLQTLVAGFLNFWCGGFAAAPQPFTNECGQDYIFCRLHPSCRYLSFVLGECRQDYIGYRRFDSCKSCPFCRPPGECRQDYNLPRYLSCHYLSPLLFKEKNHG